MSATIDLRSVESLKARSESSLGNGTHWVTVEIETRDGMHDLTLFFNSRVQAALFAKAINSAQTIYEEHKAKLLSGARP